MRLAAIIGLTIIGSVMFAMFVYLVMTTGKYEDE